MRIITRFLRLSAFSLAIALAPLTVSAATVAVNVLDGSFSPQNISVNAGDTVVWTNYGSLSHTVVSNSGIFSSASIPQGANFAYTFNTPGIYSYYDANYPSMTGSITVGGSTESVIPTYTTTQNSGTVAALQAQAQALLQEISQLEAQLGESGSTAGGTTVVNSGGCPNIGRVLSLGSSGSDVSRLQQFLAESPNIYPDGLVTGYYGPLTQAAVEAWQTQYNIVSSGSPATTGYGVVGPRTAAAIALLCSTGSTSGSVGSNVSSSQLPQVGGAIQVSPTSGTAPLTVSVLTTVNITNSCAAGNYVLNFGDGTESTAITVPTNACVPESQTFTHTYEYGGTYTIVLASGSHQTTATVTVAGNPSPAQAAASGIPADSMQASITSGPAPLAVVFTGTVSSLSSYGCSGTCTDTINFGDGAVGLVQLPTASNSWQSYIINHTYNAAGTYTAQLESVTGAPDGNPITITVTGAAAASTGTGTGAYGIVTVTPDVEGNPLMVNANVDIPSCVSYQVNWGDSSAISTQTGVCQTGGSSLTLAHTYTAAGTYTISLNDGSGNVQATAQVTIAQ